MVSTRNSIILTLIAIVVISVSGQTVLAHEGHDHGDARSSLKNAAQKTQALRTDIKTEAQQTLERIRSDVQEKNTKLKDQTTKRAEQPKATPQNQAARNEAATACKNRQTQVNMTMDTIVTRNQQRYDKITSIYDKATAYYKKSGRVVENYDALIATIEAQKQTVQLGLSSIKPTDGFNCSTGMPLQAVDDFKFNRQTTVNNIAAYRDSVKALIKAIKSSSKADASNVN